MILVTGTKRSGTSLWMQILLAAGFPAFGEAFPADFAGSLREANAEGFYESSLRDGIYYATNPNPQTGKYLFPEQVEHHAVKVFPYGVVKTDRAFITRVIATVRPFREYAASVQRLYALEDAGRDGPKPSRRDPELEWWSENYALIRDVSVRRYPVHFESFGRLHRDPERVIHEVTRWLGRGEAARAVATVKPEHRHFEGTETTTLDPAIAAVFDDFHAAIDERRPLTAAFVTKLNETHQALLPRIRDDEARVMLDRERRRGR